MKITIKMIAEMINENLNHEDHTVRWSGIGLIKETLNLWRRKEYINLLDDRPRKWVEIFIKEESEEDGWHISFALRSFEKAINKQGGRKNEALPGRKQH